MAGNSSRRGAIKKTGKGNPTAGSGGRVKRGLEGRGPTPKAKDREGHVAYKRQKRAEKAAPRRKPTVRKGQKRFAGADGGGHGLIRGGAGRGGPAPPLLGQ